MKKLIVLLVMVALIATMTALCFTACKSEEVELGPVAKEDIKVGLICLHDEASPYDNNFILAMKEAFKNLGLDEAKQLTIVRNIAESEACTTAATQLVEDGCDIIFADSFGHEEFLIPVAKANPQVQFCHATGVNASIINAPANLHNAFASIYEGRYLAGVVAGMKLKEMIDAGTITAAQAKMGYVGAHPYAEVISGYTSFYLGAKSIVPEVTMDVKYTGSWYDVTAEGETANALIDGGCKLISQHADSMGAPSACEAKNVPNVAYNLSTFSNCPKTYLTASRINWAPYYEYAISRVIAGTKIAPDWTGTLSTGSVELVSEMGTAVAAGTKEKVEEVTAKLLSGEIKVFDTNTFTVDGKKLESYMANAINDAKFTPDTQVVINGVFEESSYRSAPYFDIIIDGITILK